MWSVLARCGLFFAFTSVAIAQPVASGRPAVWRASEIANAPTTTLNLLKGANQTLVGTINTARVRTMLQVKHQIEQQARRSAELLIVEGQEPNAFTTPDSAIGPVVGLTIAMVNLLGDDPDEYAAILGHEYAHLVLGHRDARQGREALRQVGSALLALFLARAGLNYPGTVADIVATALTTSFTRDEERAADERGLSLAVLAGYDAIGAVRVWEKMSARGGIAIPFLSTHPTSNERLATMRRAAAAPVDSNGMRNSSARQREDLAVANVTLPPSELANVRGTLRKIYETNAITLGYRTNAVPLSYALVGASPIGYVIDVCHEIVDELRARLNRPSLRVIYRRSDPPYRQALVTNGEVDLDCGATANKLGRAAEVSFSNTVFVTSSKFLVRANSGIRSIQDLKGKVLISTAGTNNLNWLRDANEGHRLQAKVISVTNHSDAFAMVESGTADAFFMDDILLQTMRAQSSNPQGTVILEDTYSRDAFALMLRKDDSHFKEFVDKVLVERFSNGIMARLYDKWFMQSIPPRSIKLELAMNSETRAAFDVPNDRP